MHIARTPYQIEIIRRRYWQATSFFLLGCLVFIVAVECFGP
jgi:hypothetical protein